MDAAPLTTQQMWLATGLAAVLAVGLLLLLTWWVPPRRFGDLGRPVLALGSGFFCLLYGWAAWTYWASCYGAVLPAWVLPVAPVYGAATGTLGWVFWWLARRLCPGRPVALFLTLGALHSVPGHLHGIYGRGLLDRCGPVRGVDPEAAMTFGLFEFAVYWAGVLAVAAAWRRLRPRRDPTASGGPPQPA